MEVGSGVFATFRNPHHLPHCGRHPYLLCSLVTNILLNWNSATVSATTNTAGRGTRK